MAYYNLKSKQSFIFFINMCILDNLLLKYSHACRIGRLTISNSDICAKRVVNKIDNRLFMLTRLLVIAI